MQTWGQQLIDSTLLPTNASDALPKLQRHSPTLNKHTKLRRSKREREKRTTFLILSFREWFSFDCAVRRTIMEHFLHFVAWSYNFCVFWRGRSWLFAIQSSFFPRLLVRSLSLCLSVDFPGKISRQENVVFFLQRAHYWAACLTQSIILCLHTPINNLCWLFWKGNANLFKCSAEWKEAGKKTRTNRIYAEKKEERLKYWFSRFAILTPALKSSQKAIFLSISAL